MGAEAELLISPEIAMADLKQSMAKLDRAMKASAKKAGEEFEDELEKGIIAGAKRGFRRAGKFAAGAAGGVATGGKMAAGGLFGALMAGAATNIQRADEASGIIQGAMETSDARRLMGAADLTGMDAASMGKLWDMAKKAGFDDVKDFTDILTNIGLKVTEAETGEDPLLAAFKGLRGVDLYERVLGSIAKSDPMDQAYFLDKLEAGERLPEMSNFGQQVRALGAEGGWLATMTQAEVERGLRMLEDERKVRDFTEAQVATDEANRAAIMSAITPEKVAAFMGDQRRIANEQLVLLQTYEQNLAAAIPLREAGNAIMTEIASHTGKLVEQGAKAAQMLRDGQGANIINLSPTFRPEPKKGG